MRLGTVRTGEGERLAAAVDAAGRVFAARDLLKRPPADTMELLDPVAWAEVELSLQTGGARPLNDPVFTAPYLRPHKLWGIGLNYVDHAADLSATVPEEPASFIKGDHTIIGPGEEIPLPAQSERVTAEAELGLVIGRYCRNVSEEEALAHVAGVTTVLDQTAEDILQRNPRFLTWSKNFPGFFSFGPQIVPLDEVVARGASLGELEVATVIDGRVHRASTVANMRFSPELLVSFHSRIMPLLPGDVISTGTPGAAVIRPGMVATCRITGLPELSNPVVAG
jgi:2-keto-4-pentenoate hydratase/2-oxohepta-3-ene-1,7-dioic acid hydratase in catechol pathway